MLKFFEKIFKFTYENLNAKLFLFPNFQSDLPGTLSFYTAPENNTIFLQHFFGFDGISPAPYGSPCARKYDVVFNPHPVFNESSIFH